MEASQGGCKFAQQKYTSTGDQRRMDMIKRLHFTPRNFFLEVK